MAHESADLTSLVEILKYDYGTGLKNQMDDAHITYNLFPKSVRKATGLGYKFGLRYSRTQSTGARDDNQKLPDPMTGKKDQGLINTRNNYGTIRLTGPAILAAKGDTAAYVDGLADEMDDIFQSIKTDMNRECHWDGFGKVGVVSASFAPSTSTTYATTFNNDLGIKYMQEGMLIDFYGVSGITCSTTCVAQRILTIKTSTKVVIFETSGATWKANHPNDTIAAYTNDQTAIPVSSIAVKMGARRATFASETDTPYEITGLEGIFDDGTLLASFEDIIVATHPKWAANVMSNGAVNRELELDLMLNALDLTRINGGGMIANRILCGLGQQRKYANLLMPHVQFQPQVLKGGWNTLAFAGGNGEVEMIFDPMAQSNTMYVYPEGIIEKFEASPLGWGNLDGSEMHLRQGYDSYDLFVRIISNLGCEQRNCLTKITDLVEPSLY
jgi:hypothetical protein